MYTTPMNCEDSSAKDKKKKQMKFGTPSQEFFASIVSK